MSVKDPLLEAVTPDTKWYVVLRPFGGDNTTFVRGEVVDTTGWIHRNALVNRRYIAPFPYGGTIPEPSEQPDGTIRRVIVEDQKEVKPKASKARKSA